MHQLCAADIDGAPATLRFPHGALDQKRLAPQRVWELTTGQGVVVGVIDTGVDGGIPQLAGRVLPGVNVVNGGGPANNDCLRVPD